MQPIYNFALLPCVVKQINALTTVDQRVVVMRCVGGYSPGLDMADRVSKIFYRYHQRRANYPDWKESSNILDTRKKIEWIDTCNPGLDFPMNFLMLPGMILAKAGEKTGEDKLKELIKENSKKD